jgi:hypothetical protein
MKKWLAALFLSLVIVSPAWADSLTISGSDVNWTTNNSSPTFTVQIANPTGTAQSLYAWQLGFFVAADTSGPNAGTGTVNFATEALPTNNYVMAGNSTGLFPSAPLPSTSIPIVADATPDNTGSILALGSSFNLLNLTFNATPGAKGVFDIYAMPLSINQTSGSGWYSSDFNGQGFGNVSTTGGPTLLGQLTLIQPFSVPEPNSIILLVTGCAGLLAYRRVRRARAA